jgi:Carboxypeptidase regulatory-like domain
MDSQLHRLWRVKVWNAAVLLAPLPMAFATTQEPAYPASATPALNSQASTDKSSHKKYSHANDFLVRGTVFNEKALSFPSVELRIRVAGEKKYRWDTYTNSRGEFAVRVPQGASYEVTVRVKGFEEQTRIVDAKSGGNEETIVFRMQPIAGGKK